MARLIPTKFEVYRDQTKNMRWANYANENILLHTHQKHGKKITDLTDLVIKTASQYAPSLSGKSTSLWDGLIKKGSVRTVESDEVEWSLRGSGRVEILALENVMPGVKFPGHNNTEFQIKLETSEFVEGDIIAPEVAKEIPVVVQYLPVGDGIGSIYTVQLSDSDPAAYFPPELLEAGLKWCKLGSAYGEGSRDFGSTSFTSGASFIKFRSNLTDWGKSVEVTNKADQLRLELKAVSDKGVAIEGFPSQIISWIEAEFLAQAKYEKELMCWYGRSAGKSVMDTSSGYHRRIGPGVMEFMEDANLITYTLGNFNIDTLIDWLQEVQFDRISPENSNIIVQTGAMGMKQAHRSIRDLYNKLNITVPFDKFVKSADGYPGSNSGGFGLKEPAFLEIELFPYGSIRFQHLPMLDNRELNGSIVHPETGLPLSSYYYFIMDYGFGEAGNVELLKQADSEIYTYICGTWSPAGPINGRTNRAGFVATHPGRSYELKAADTFGVRIKDVNMCAMMLPAVQY